MANRKPSWIERIARIEPGITVGQWLYDRIANNWIALVALFGGGGMTWAASVSTTISSYGPIGWVSIGIGTTLVAYLLLALGFYVFARAKERSAMAKLAERQASTTTVNTLAPTHSHEKINLSEFFHPFYRTSESVRFEDCDVFGPAMIFVDGGTFTNSTFGDCDVVIARNDRAVRGVIKFRFPTFNRCHLYRLTFVMNWQMYQTMPQQFRDGVTVISDGRIGDV